jgi:ATP/maltotriose-dependent transcriptional regulator MalT
MILLERESDLTLLQQLFSSVTDGEGHCVFVSGESGIGKTSLLKHFTAELKKDYKVYEGLCDALFTPRPLAPLYDIALQISADIIDNSANAGDRAALFSNFFNELRKQREPVVIVFEDIHWADYATIDFIKFFARRITQLRCLFILTYRDNEIHIDHPIVSMFGQLTSGTFSRINLSPLSLEAVKQLAEEKGYDGQKVYEVSGGNPYYVTEILSTYSEGVPANIRDAIISAYNRTSEKTRQVWELLSVIPGRFETRYLERFDPGYRDAIDNCIQLKILIHNGGEIHFKHELFRRTIEHSLSPLKRIALNRKILELFMNDFAYHNEIERIVHHATNANEYDLVLKYAPIAAKHAAALGAHTEASKLLATAIENYQGDDIHVQIALFEKYSYECYLTNNIEQATLFAGKTLQLLKGHGNITKIAGCMRFMSHLRCCCGDWKTAVNIASEAIELIRDQPASKEKALLFCNMAQLKMHWGETNEIVDWAEKARKTAGELNDDEVLCQSEIIIGTIRMNTPSLKNEGWELIQKGLSAALKNSFQESAARAYSKMAINGMRLKDYPFVKKILHEGLLYSEERELDFWKLTMLSVKAKFHLETGNWHEAFTIAQTLQESVYKGSFNLFGMVITGQINMRRGHAGAIEMLMKAKTAAQECFDLQALVSAVIALLEFEWLTGETKLNDDELKNVIGVIDRSIYYMDANEFAFWLFRARNQRLKLRITYDAYHVNNVAAAHKAAGHWHKLGNPYLQAHALFNGDDEDKKKAISIVQHLDATTVYERMKREMRSSGIKGIPRGLRKTTKENPALLTGREMDVLQLLKDGLQNKEIANKLFISAKTVDHHISSILFKLDVNSRVKAVNEAVKLDLLK